MTKRLKQTATLGAAAWVVLMPATPALTQAICGGTSQTFVPSVAEGARIDPAQPYNWVAPAGVTSVVIRAAGAEGGTSSIAQGGRGATVEATYPLAPGQRLCIVVGVQGQGQVGNLAAGGGGSFVFSTGQPSCLLADASVSNLLVAAAGGGAGGGATSGLPGRASGLGAGAAGALAGGVYPGGPAAAINGAGGAGVFGGGGGGLLTDGGAGSRAGAGRALISGGAGGSQEGFGGDGGFGGGGAGGGGGGYNGGAGSSGSEGRSGGGGGSFSSVLPTNASDGVQSGNGEVVICAVPPPPAPVPTLTEWAMIGLTGLLALCGLSAVGRRGRMRRGAA